MNIRVSPRTAMRIYLGVSIMLLISLVLLSLMYWRSGGKNSSDADLQAPRGQISVSVQAVAENNPTAPAEVVSQQPDTSTGSSDTQDFWYYLKVTRKLLYLAIILSFLAWVCEGAIRWIMKKERPKMCDIIIKPFWLWPVAAWKWNQERREAKKQNGSPSSPTPDTKKKARDKWYTGWMRVIGVLFKWGLVLVVFAIVYTTIAQPRTMSVLIQQFSRSLTGETFPVVDRMLVETAPDQNEIQRGLPPEQQNPRVMSWIAVERKPSGASIIETAPRSFKTDYIMSDEIAFQIHMKDIASNGEIIIMLRHNRSGELYGWWERIGGPKLDMVITKPSWRADRMPDGSFYLRLQDEKVPTLFEDLRIVAK